MVRNLDLKRCLHQTSCPKFVPEPFHEQRVTELRSGDDSPRRSGRTTYLCQRTPSQVGGSSPIGSGRSSDYPLRVGLVFLGVQCSGWVLTDSSHFRATTHLVRTSEKYYVVRTPLSILLCLYHRSLISEEILWFLQQNQNLRPPIVVSVILDLFTSLLTISSSPSTTEPPTSPCLTTTTSVPSIFYTNYLNSLKRSTEGPTYCFRFTDQDRLLFRDVFSLFELSLLRLKVC